MKKAVKRRHYSAFLRKWWQLLVIMFAFTSAAAQDSAKYAPINGYGFRYKRHAVDSVMLVPYYESSHVPYRAGAIKYRRSDSSFYKYTGTQWLKVQEGGAATNGIDTVYTQDDTIQVIVTADETYYTIINSPYTEVLNDSTIIVGSDTLVIIGGAGGGGSGSNNTNTGSGFRVLNVGTQEMRTLFGSNTITIDSSSNSGGLTFKADTSVLATQYDLTQLAEGGITQLTGDVTAGPGSGSQAATIANNAVTTAKIADNNVTNAKIVAFKPYPAAAAWNTIYEKNSWTALSDFNPQGTASISLNSNALRISAATQDYTPVVRILRSRPTGLKKWKMTFRYRVIAWASTTNWFGPQIKSLVSHSGANFGYQAFTAVDSDGAGNSFITDEAGTILVSGGAGPTKSLNDLMEATWERNDTTLRYTIRNVTTLSATQTLDYPFPANHATILPNVGTWSFMYNASSTGIIQVDYIKIESDELLSPNVLCIGDSKTAIGYADSYAGRWPALLNATYPDVTYSAGSAEYITDALYKVRELGQMNPQKVIMGFIGENDIRDGVPLATVVANMQRLDNLYRAGGTEVYWICLPEDSTGSGANLTALKNAVEALFPGRVINTWDALSTNNVLDAIYNSGDDVHLNQAGMNQIVSTIIASGLLTTSSTQLRTERRRNDGIIQSDGDSTWFAFPISPFANNVPMFDTSFNIVGSRIWQDASGRVRMSSNLWPISPLTNAQLAVEGPIVSYGTTGGRYLYDRTTPANNFSEYVNSNTLYRGYNGTDYHFIGTTGNMRIGPGSGISSTTIPSRLQLRGNYSFTNSTPGYTGHLLNVDTTTITFSGSTGIGDVSANSFGPITLAASGTSNADTASNVTITDAIADGANMTSAVKLSLHVRKGRTHLGGGLSMLNTLAGSASDNVLVIGADSLVRQVPAASFGGGISGLTAGRVTLSTSATSIGDDGNLLYSTSNAGTLSLGTSATVGHLNIGGNRNFDGSATSTGYGVGINFPATTFTDNVTSASGSTNFSKILLDGPVLAASNSSVTATSPVTLRVSAPTAGTNVTIGIPYSIAGFGGSGWINGTLKQAVTSGVHNTTVSYTDPFTTCDATSGNFNIILPDATTYAGHTFTFKRLDNSGNTCTVSTTSSQTIDGSTTYSLSAQWKYVTVIAVSGNWLIKANN